MSAPNRNRKVFIIVFIAFVLVVIGFAVDMASRTKAPWNKKKQLERALPGAVPPIDTLFLDSLLQENERP